MSALPTPDTLFVSGPSKPTPDTPEGGDFAITDGGVNVLAEVFHRVREDRTQDAQAIALLFAAAPDLLAALQAFMATDSSFATASEELLVGMIADGSAAARLAYPVLLAKRAIARVTGSAT